MVNECVGPDRDGCTAKTVTDAKYGKHSRDGGKLCRACYGKKSTSAPARLGRSLRCPPHTHLVTWSPHALHGAHGRAPRVALSRP